MSSNKPQFTPEQLKQLVALQQMMQQKNLTKQQIVKQKIVAGIFQRMQSWVHYLDRFVNFITKKHDGDRNDVIQATRSPVLFGTYVIIFFVGFGGLWMAAAPLDSAAPAMGVVVSSTNKKTIQHPEGGIIKNILVKQGDHVKEGQVLIQLEDTKTKSDYDSILNQYRSFLASESRLFAERDNLESIQFPAFLTDSANIPEVEKIMLTQENLFASRKEVIRAERESLKQKISQSEKQIEGLEARKVSYKKSLEVTSDRLKAMKTLLAKGYAQKSTILDLEAKEAQAKSEIATVDTDIARTMQEITRAEIEMMNLQNKYIERALSELKETQYNLGTAKEKYLTLADALKRIDIKSPVDGIVNSMRYHTIGGVITSGQPILEISPINDFLVIEAKVPQKNIDSVHIGLLAKIRFSAFKSRTTPLFTGKVVSISPDVQEQNQNSPQQESYYIARIEIDMEEFNKIAKARKLELHPGMQADIQIVTGTRTLLRYLLDPIIDTMFRAFKEK